MSGKLQADGLPDPAGTVLPEPPAVSMTLAAEDVAITKRVRRTLVRASRTTATRDEVFTEDLAQEQVVVDRVPVGRVVEDVPPVRQEGEVTIVPVVEEELVVIRRLVLKEEVHLRRVRSVTTRSVTVQVRSQDVNVTRTPLDD